MIFDTVLSSMSFESSSDTAKLLQSTDGGRLFQMCAAATGKQRSPMELRSVSNMTIHVIERYIISCDIFYLFCHVVEASTSNAPVCLSVRPFCLSVL